MSLKPALREKKRYIVFRIHSDEKIPYFNIKSAIFDSILEFLGEKGFSQASPRLIKNLYTGKTGFLQTNPKFVDPVKMSLSLIHQIGDSPAIFQTLKVSGTIQSGKKSIPKSRRKK